MNRAIPAVRRGFWLLCLLPLACGQTRMVNTLGKVRGQMLRGNYDAALAQLRKAKKKGAFGEQDRVAYWMDEGMLLYLSRQYKPATQVLQQAERRSEELFTRSIRKDVKAAFTSQAATDYQGEDYEKILLNVMKAFSYLALRDFGGAMVEARKINEKLQAFNTKYQGKNTYNQDAFAHWLVGLLSEMEGSYDDARISYDKAWQTYRTVFARDYGSRVPSYVAEDFARAARLSGANEELDKRRDELGSTAGQSTEMLKSRGEIVLFHLNGEGPSKTDFFVTCVFRSAASWYCDGEPGGEFIRKTRIRIPRKADVVRVAFPRLIVRSPASQTASMEAAGQRAVTQVAYPLSRIAKKSLGDKTGRIFKNAVVRAITKLLASKAAGAAGKKSGGRQLGFLAKAATSAAFQATEEADKRAWTTLPSRIDVGRLWVEPGSHTVVVRLANGRSVTIPGVNVAAGKRVFISLRTLP